MINRVVIAQKFHQFLDVDWMQEDLCLLMKIDGELRFVSGAVLFPQRWQLLEKLGMDLRNIHLPVPLYEEEIGPKVAAFMDRLKVGKPVWRANWVITISFLMPFRVLYMSQGGARMENISRSKD